MTDLKLIVFSKSQAKRKITNELSGKQTVFGEHTVLTNRSNMYKKIGCDGPEVDLFYQPINSQKHCLSGKKINMGTVFAQANSLKGLGRDLAADY